MSQKGRLCPPGPLTGWGVLLETLVPKPTPQTPPSTSLFVLLKFLFTAVSTRTPRLLQWRGRTSTCSFRILVFLLFWVSVPLLKRLVSSTKVMNIYPPPKSSDQRQGFHFPLLWLHGVGSGRSGESPRRSRWTIHSIPVTQSSHLHGRLPVCVDTSSRE